MKKLFILCVLLISLIKICYAQNYIFMTKLHDNSNPQQIYSCAIKSNGIIDTNCQLIFTLPAAQSLSSSPVIVNQSLIFAYGFAGDYQTVENCNILENGLLDNCTENIFSDDGSYYYGFITGYAQPSESCTGSPTVCKANGGN